MAAAPIVIQQQPRVVPMVTEWSSGLCHCGQDLEACCFAFWCFPCFACKTTSEFNESLCLPLVDLLGPALVAATGMGICVPPVTLSMRVAIRYKYAIPGSMCEDIMVSCFCLCCSWCQMNREIMHRKRTAAVLLGQNVPFTTVTATVPTIIT